MKTEKTALQARPVATPATPKKAVRDEELAANKEKFLEAMSRLGRADLSAQEVGVDRSTVYRWAAADEEFNQAWERARAESAHILEDEAHRRAVEGVEEPVFYLGEECGKVRKYSDTLLIFLLKGAKPDKYRERVDHTGEVNIRHGRIKADELHDDALAAIAASALPAKGGEVTQTMCAICGEAYTGAHVCPDKEPEQP